MKVERFSYRIVVCGFMLSMIVISSACSPVATAPPTPVPVTPSATLTPAPTITVTPSPTPMLNPQDFYGMWTIWDPDAKGPNFLTFNEDGTFSAAHGPNQGKLLHEGTYTLVGNKLTFLDWWFCEPDQQVGAYLIRMGPENEFIRFIPLDDPCEERAQEFTNRIIKWNRFVPTATPNP